MLIAHQSLADMAQSCDALLLQPMIDNCRGSHASNAETLWGMVMQLMAVSGVIVAKLPTMKNLSGSAFCCLDEDAEAASA